MLFAGQTYHPKISILLLFSMMLFLLVPVGEAVAGIWGSECPVAQARHKQAAVTTMSCCPSENPTRSEHAADESRPALLDGLEAYIPQSDFTACGTTVTYPSCCASCTCWIDVPNDSAALAPAVQRTVSNKEQPAPELNYAASLLLYSALAGAMADADEIRIRPYLPNESFFPAAALPLRIAFCCYLI